MSEACVSVGVELGRPDPAEERHHELSVHGGLELPFLYPSRRDGCHLCSWSSTAAAERCGGGCGRMTGCNGWWRAPRHVAALRTAATALALARGSPVRNDSARGREPRCSRKNVLCVRYIFTARGRESHCGQPYSYARLSASQTPDQLTQGAVVVDPTYHSILCRVCRQRGATGEVIGRRTVQIARFSWRRVNRRLHSLS